MHTELARNLLGKKVGQWTVVKKLSGDTNQGGGGFSSGYLVKSETGVIGYLKALNVHYAFTSTGKNFTDILNDLTGDYNHERDLVKYCNEKNLDHIVIAIDSGNYNETGNLIPVPYLVFEFCEKGDITRHPQMRAPDLIWRLTVFHGVCVGLWQLHRHGISHQDMKPANVLVFHENFSKLADLGRSTKHEIGARFGSPTDVGDMSYAPFELWYGVYHADWAVRRKATDLFMLGGILAFLISNINLLSRTIERLPKEMQPRTSYNLNGWSGTYEALIPTLQRYLNETIVEIVQDVRSDLRYRIERLLCWLCEPNPLKRGHPETINQVEGDRYSLERIVSIADRLAKDARVSEIQ